MLPTGKIILTNQIENFNCRMSPTGSGIKAGTEAEQEEERSPVSVPSSGQWENGTKDIIYSLLLTFLVQVLGNRPSKL